MISQASYQQYCIFLIIRIVRPVSSTNWSFGDKIYNLQWEFPKIQIDRNYNVSSSASSLWRKKYREKFRDLYVNVNVL